MRIEPPLVKPKIIRWAVERSGYNRQDLEAKFKKLPEWERGLSVPTRGQLEKFANAMHVPYAFMFLDKPPKESISIPDFRTLVVNKLRVQVQIYLIFCEFQNFGKSGTENFP